MGERPICGGAISPVFIYNSENAGVKTCFGSIIVTDIGIASVHVGKAFRFCHFEQSLGPLEDFYIHWLIGEKECHATSSLSIGGQSRIRVYNRPILSSNGIEIPIYNLHLGKLGSIPTTKAFATPTISDLGTNIIRDEFVPGGSVGTKVGSATRENTELVIARYSSVVARITNLAAQEVMFSYTGNFFEE